MSEVNPQMFAITGIDSRVYKDSISEVMRAMTNFDNFTNNLETKVDTLLKAQETEFVKSYKFHMGRIKSEFGKMQQELQKKEKKILEYQNEGKMSLLLKRVNFLEEKEKAHLDNIDKKNQKIKALQLENRMIKSECKRLQEKIKILFKKISQMEERLQASLTNQPVNESLPTFATQLQPAKSNDRLSKVITRAPQSLHQKSEKSLHTQIQNNSRLSKELNKLKKQNHELRSINIRMTSETNSMESFFFQTVNEIKKNIIVRKGIEECSFEDFRKEDKLQLLIRILSNEQILLQLHQLIFMPKRLLSSLPDQRKQKIDRLRSAKIHFPTIKSTRFP